MIRGKRENFFSREKKFSRSPRAPLTLSRKAKNFFICFYLPLSGTEPFLVLSQFLRKLFETDDKQYFVIRLNITHKICFVKIRKTLVSIGGCIREARSRFALSTARECTSVHDRRGADARREIDRGAPPPFRLS
ncbi:MAG: hypothetical protein J6R00_01045, partial [Lentisphaeria bacterium]|nr:hypothetical protein [Lentisphaeria bacterium]